MIIRLLEAEDAAIYRRLRIAGLKESPISFGSSHLQESKRPLEYFQERIAPTEERWVLGAFERKKLVGVVGFVRESGFKTRHKGFIWGMYVAPKFRGEGIGHLLFQEALLRIDTIPGLRWVSLSVTTVNVNAIRLYEKFGFVRFGEEPEALCVGKKYYAEYHLVRRTKKPKRRRPRG